MQIENFDHWLELLEHAAHLLPDRQLSPTGPATASARAETQTAAA